MIFFYIVYKSHIEHTVGLIQYKEFYVLQRDISLVNEVKQTTWRCNKNIYTVPQ